MPIASGTHASDAPPAETGACDPAHDLVLFASSGATARLVRSMDWTDTPLGPLKDWPIGLRTLVDMLLGHPLPTLLLWGPEHAQIYNDGFARICDERKSEGLGRPTRLWWPEAWEIHGPIVRRIMAGGAPAYLEDQPLPSGAGSEGDERYFTITYSPAHEQSGAVGGVLITLVDTTGKVLAERVRREAEQALRDSEERYRLVSRATNEVIWDWHLPSDVLLWNEAVEQVFGHKLDHIPPLIEWWYEHIHPDDRERVIEAIQNVVEGGGGESWRDEYRFRRADESYATVFDRGFLQRDERGRPMRMIGSMLDLTERRHAEEELRQAKEQAEAASRAKDEFLAVLSHELRTPLTPVLLTVSLMESHPQLPEDLQRDVAMIRQNVELEARLIGDLLDLTRIAKNKLELHLTTVDVHEIIQSALAICRRDDGPEIMLNLSAPRRHVRGDTARLQQVFWNLVNNAQKFTPEDGTISIRTTCRGAGKVLRIEVADTGAGIDPQVLPRLFNAFEQGGERLPRQFGGLGLGLAISRSLVKAHGGRISAQSEGRSRGSRFVVDLPTVAPPPTKVAPARGRPAAPAQTPAAESTRTLRVLLVEDHEATAAAMRKLLNRLGHKTSVASTLASGQLALQGERFDLVISDLGLPDGSGLELLRDVRQQYAGRAIALTGYGMEEDVNKSRQAGFAAHVTKPVDFERLQSLIQHLVTERR